MRRLILLVVPIIACAPAPQNDLTEDQENQISQAIEGRIQGYCGAVLRRDPEWLHGFWADVEGFTVAGDGEVWTEHKTMADATTAWFEMIEEVLYCNMNNTRVYVLGRDAASATTEFAWGIKTHEGATIESYGGWTYVFDRIDGEFRVVHSGGYRLYKEP